MMPPAPQSLPRKLPSSFSFPGLAPPHPSPPLPSIFLPNPNNATGQSLVPVLASKTPGTKKNYKSTLSGCSKLKGKKKKGKKKEKENIISPSINQSPKSSPIRSHSHTLHTVRVPRIELKSGRRFEPQGEARATTTTTHTQQKRNARHSFSPTHSLTHSNLKAKQASKGFL